ncbi:hypothetical protein C1I63_03205 [Rathayibacter caricis DSM 15933]|uniref:F420-dependent oxidoreductase n=1 Tax=Rathayibacter caricis DSM 15933 TaxID=1328867 RepID=A0A2T4UQX9_9MICO|nr:MULTISPECIES: Pr6Pr family membrane protein [Rathayibacter]KQQ20504.1 hypothetical protein ASF48_07640 [Rathayibacter sp. Leaf299]MCJ1697621.1 Pr6Pr family membrane protein [Rathayibacter caricis]PTL71942.1 hypothetical protein C1I63_03205 [Rathayibacter caricis DSM 15933]
MRKAFAILRLALAGLGVVGLVADFFYTLGFRAFQIDNFFAYFTTQSNMAGVVLLGLSGLVALARTREPRWLSTVRALVLTYMVVSGIVFGLIAVEAGNRGVRVDVPWSSALLHFVIPTLAMLDWILGPGRRPVPWRSTLTVLGFPVVWGVITLVRGALIGWYPYFFLDPDQVDGPVMYVVYDVIVLGLISGIAAFVVALSRVRPLGESHTAEWRGPFARLRELVSRGRRRTAPAPSPRP